MSAAGPCNYTFLKIVKPTGHGEKNAGVEVETKGKILGLDYYESVYSPMVTANMVQFDTGNSVVDSRTGLRGTLKDALPLEGMEEVFFNVATRYGDLNFLDIPMIVTGTPLSIDEPQKQTVNIPLVSEGAMTCAKKPLSNVYQEARISDIVEKILDEYDLLINEVEATKNVDKVSGGHNSPLDVILGLCKKSFPADYEDPGYFFFETKSGYNFRSIDGMITEGIRRIEENLDGYADSHTYKYFGSLDAKLEQVEGNDFKVLRPPLVKKDQDQLSALKHGKYNVRVCTLNTLTHEYNEKIENLLLNLNTTLGDIQQEHVEDEDYCKSYTYVLNPGADEQGVSEKILNNPAEYEPMANMRYGMLHTQLIDVQVPCNVRLEAGDVIKLWLENITQDEKLLSIYNQHRSGYYLILNLCHHFDTDNSYTSMTLARDTYGLYANNY